MLYSGHLLSGHTIWEPIQINFDNLYSGHLIIAGTFSGPDGGRYRGFTVYENRQEILASKRLYNNKS